MTHSGLTIEVDDATADSLRNLTRIWGVPPQEAVARAVQVAVQNSTPPASGEQALHVFRELQRTAGMTADKAVQWKEAAREGRR